MPTLTSERPSTEIVWRAQPKQATFLRASEFAVLYGGAAGGGKTDALLIDLIRCCVKHRGAKTLFVRKTFADLGKPGAAIDRSRELLSGVAEWDGQEHKWEFSNGSRLQFGHLQYEQSIYSYQGSQLDRLAFDELTQFAKRQFLYLVGRVRSTVTGSAPAVRAGTNPGGLGHGWVKQMFVDAAPWGDRFDLVDVDSREVIPGGARFIPAKLADNPAMVERDPEYGRRLELLPDDLKRAYRDGDWDVFSGQFFGEWRRSLHVCEPFPIPAGWPRWRCVDWGYGSPFCCLWLARSPDRRIYVYREAYGAGILDSDQAKGIAALSRGELIRTTYADPSMWNSQPNGSTIAGVYASKGVPVVKANNDRNAGWQRVREALAGERPTLQVFATCLNLIRTLPLLIHDEIDVEDVDSDGEDHAADALRYGLTGGLPGQATKTPVVMGGGAIKDTRHWAERAEGVMVR